MACTMSVFIIFSIVVAGIFSYPLDSKPENSTAKESFRPVSLPTDFGSYDPNANGYIDLEELAQVTGTTLDDARKPFMDADIDDDDQVSPAEFERAPWTLSALKREEIVSEEDGDDDEEEQIDDDNDEEEVPLEETDDETEDDEETPIDGNAEERAPVPESDDNMDEEEGGSDDEESVFDNADDILVDVAKSTAEDDDGEKLSMEKSNEDEVKEEPSEDYDESRAIESSEEEVGEEDGQQVDPLLEEDHLSKQEDVIAENEFVENAIF